MAKFRLAAKADDEVWGIWRYIARDNPAAAIKVVEAAYRTFQFLADNPKVGTKREFPRISGEIRAWTISGYDRYVILYALADDGIVILRLYHSARNFKLLFEDYRS